VSPETLSAAIGCKLNVALKYAEHINEACLRYYIDTDTRLSAFIAQVGHESMSLRYTVELWGPTPAQVRYEGRLDLGNTQPGDGSKFRGHGFIQVTGRANHAAARDALADLDCPDFEEDPASLSQPRWAALSAGEFWGRNGCNGLADTGDFKALTKRINGGLNGYEDRLVRWEKAKAVLMFALD